jgi:FkbM family methyltransferase
MRWRSRVMKTAYAQGMYDFARRSRDKLCDWLAAAMLRNDWLEARVLRGLSGIRGTRLGRGLQGQIVSSMRQRSLGDPKGQRWVRTETGVWIRVHISTRSGWLYFGRAYEPATTQFIVGHLKQGSVFVDVGANLGYFSMLAAQRVGPEGRVLAFEPAPEAFGMLTSAVSRNRFTNVQPFKVALGDQDCEVELFLSNDPANDGLSSITPFIEHIKSGALSAEHIVRVAAHRFDSLYVDPQFERIDLIKIDVEGAELGVLRGMENTFERFAPPKIIIETHLRGEVTDWLTARGYTAEALELARGVFWPEWGNIVYVRR